MLEEVLHRRLLTVAVEDGDLDGVDFLHGHTEDTTSKVRQGHREGENLGELPLDAAHFERKVVVEDGVEGELGEVL
jgi:hypothetical protein